VERGPLTKDIDGLLEAYGFAFPQHRLARTPEEAARVAEEIGFPVVLKIASPDILHKIDVGGVELSVGDRAEAEAAFRRICSTVAKRSPGARIDGVRIEESCTDGLEIFIGLEHNAQFGPTIVFGLGGIFAEVIRDVTFRILPIDRGDAAAMLKEIAGRRILEGYRGQPAASRDLLVELLVQAGRLGLDQADRLMSVDLNPIVIHGGDHRVLDAKGIWAEEPRRTAELTSNVAFLERFFDATSVAVVGASQKPEKIGHAILHSLVNMGYRGGVYPIHPSASEIMGKRAYPSVREVPEPIELAVAAIPLASIPEVLDDLFAKGIHNLVIVSGGGKELGEAGIDVEEGIGGKARGLDVRIVGPNCIGVFNGHNRLDTFFQLGERMTRPRPGSLAVLTQSGTVGVALLEQAGAVGISKFVSYGNRIDVDEADLLSYLAEDTETAVIACYIEGLNNGRKFLQAARAVTERKPVVVYKAGRAPAAAKAAVSHTGFFGGTYGPWLGAFRQVGVTVVDSVDGLIAAAKTLVMQPAASGNRVAMISNGAGPMVQALDLYEQHGLQLAELADATVERLREAYPPYFLAKNPVDVTGSGTVDDYAIGIDALLGDPGVDVVMPWLVFQDPALGEGIVDVLDRLSRGSEKPIVCGAIGGIYTEGMSLRIEEIGVPVLRSVPDWVVAAAGLVGRGRRCLEQGKGKIE